MAIAPRPGWEEPAWGRPAPPGRLAAARPPTGWGAPAGPARRDRPVAARDARSGQRHGSEPRGSRAGRGPLRWRQTDPGLELLARYRDQLREKYLLDLCNPAAQLCMLDKLATYQAAVKAGVPTPKFWVAQNRQQVLGYRDQLVYPLLVKPLLSHVYRG